MERNSPAELIQRFRVANRDDVEPYLWSDEEITSYLFTSMEHVCGESGFGGYDDTLVATIVPGVTTRLPSHVVQVIEAIQADTGKRLGIRSPAQVADPYSTRTGNLEALLQLDEGRAFRAYPAIPAAVDVRFVVLRIPVITVLPTPSIVAIDAPSVVLAAVFDYMRYLAYGKDDAETKNEREQERMLSLYTTALQLARIAVSRQNHRVRVVKFNSDY